MNQDQLLSFLNFMRKSFTQATKTGLAKKATNYLRDQNLDGTVYWSSTHNCFYVDYSVNIKYDKLY